MVSSRTQRLLRWRIITIAGQLVVAAGYGASAVRTPSMGLMLIPPLAIVGWSIHGLVRRSPDRLSLDQLVAEFGLVRGLGLGTLWWVGLAMAGAVLAALTGAYLWGLLGVLGLFVFGWIGSAHERALKRISATTDLPS